MTWQPDGGRGHLAVTSPQPMDFAWDLPDGPLQHALSPVIGVRRLLARADVEQYGSLLEILDDRRKTVARLRIESGRARLPVSRGAWQRLPTILTLMGLRGYEDVSERLVPVIESRPGIRPCPEGFHGVILQETGAAGITDGSSPRVDLAPAIRADAGARQIHRALLGVLLANEPGLRANLDSEFLHDFRVALRRARSLLGQLKHVFPPDIVEHFSTEMSWLGRLTGPPRDMDVLVLTVTAHQGDIPPGDMELLIAFLRQAQERERLALVEALDSRRYRRFVSAWQKFLERPAAPDPGALHAGLPLVDIVTRRAWRLSRRIARSAEGIDACTAPAQLHKVRIDAKKLRYLVDATPAFYAAADLECILGALKKLQRVLGDFNDSQVQQTRLLECGQPLGEAGGPVSAVLALGQLAEQSRQRGERLRPEVADQLARFGGGATRSACRRAFKRRAPMERTR
jgi:CHAD domain-containing protein